MKSLKNNHYPAWTEVDLANIEYNYKQLKSRAGAGMKMLVAVKADAYGHGMVEVSRRLERCKVDYLGVASVNEAMVLRNNGIRSPVLVMGNVYDPFQIKTALKNNISLTAADLKGAEIFSRISNLKHKLNVHIKIDTGMGRIGIWHEDAFDQVQRIAGIRQLNVEGIFTHFPSADCDDDFTNSQLAVFNRLIGNIEKAGIHIPLRHAANSIALSRKKDIFAGVLNMVRPGIMVYGMYPAEKTAADKRLRLRPALELKSRVVFIKDVRPGQTISYGRTHKVRKATRIATISIGYADGYLRCLSNKSHVKIKEKLYPVVGRICMDQTMVDIGLNSRISLGDEVTLIGKDKSGAISAENTANLCGTIPYEITCGISARVGRLFKKD